jgi:hypothetical protein
MEFDDIVTLRSRTGEVIAIMVDSRERYVIPGKGKKDGLKVSREMAELGIKQHAFRWDGTSGIVTESLLYIEEDLDSPLETPNDKLDMKDVAKVKKTDGLGKGKAFIDGSFVQMKALDLGPTKESFANNNV